MTGTLDGNQGNGQMEPSNSVPLTIQSFCGTQPIIKMFQGGC